jgi:hypothetical protein
MQERRVIDQLVLMTLRKVTVMLHPSSSREQDTNDLESQVLHQCRRQHRRQGLGHEMKRCCGDMKRSNAGGRAAPFFFSLALP